MCFVSLVTSGISAQQLPPVSSWSYPIAAEFQQILQRLDAIDQKLGLRDCHDALKAEFLAALAARIADLEQRLP